MKILGASRNKQSYCFFGSPCARCFQSITVLDLVYWVWFGAVNPNSITVIIYSGNFKCSTKEAVRNFVKLFVHCSFNFRSSYLSSLQNFEKFWNFKSSVRETNIYIYLHKAAESSICEEQNFLFIVLVIHYLYSTRRLLPMMLEIPEVHLGPMLKIKNGAFRKICSFTYFSHQESR